MHTAPMHTDIRDTLCTPGMSCQGTNKLIRCSVVRIQCAQLKVDMRIVTIY